MACQYEAEIRAAAARYGINGDIAVRQFLQENGCRPTGCSAAGACGIAQFIPATAARFGLTDRNNVIASLDAWGRYMSQLLSMFGGRMDLALAGYNWGEHRATLQKAYQEGKPVTAYSIPSETRNYVNGILGGSVTATGGASASTVRTTTGLFSGLSTTTLVLAGVALLFVLKR